MKLLTWNCQFGKASRKWPMLVEAIGTDVAFLQEVFAPPSSRGTLWKAVPQRKWGSAVVSTSAQLNEVSIDGYEGWVIGGELVDGTSAIRCFVFSVHAPTPSKTAARASYVNEVVKIVEGIHAQVPTGAQLIIGGDFNFASLGKRQTRETPATTAAEKRALATIASRGLVPLWEACHSASPLPQTLRWSKNRATPFHCDGFLVNSTHSPEALCEVLTSQSIAKSSDHNAVAAWLSI